jgi:pseudouridine kinase
MYLDKEQHILALIRENPFLSQQELSIKLGLSRSAVAGYISTLAKKGEIVGRAYILREDSRITCIGGANVDRKSQTLQPIQYGTSNPAVVTQSCGGVGRNVAENLGRLGCSTSLITLLGDDQEGKWLLEETKRYGVDVSQSIAMEGEKTGTYSAILNNTGEMVLAVADMQIYDKISRPFIAARWPHLASSRMIFADTNLPADVLAYLIERCEKEKLSLCINPVSAPKAMKLPASLHGVELLIPNRDELEAMSGVVVESIEDCKKACELIMQRGVKQLIVTLGKQGVFWVVRDGEYGHLDTIATEIVDVTGAGDSLVAGVLFGLIHGEPFERAARLGMMAASVTLQTQNTVANLTADQLYTLLDETKEE